MLRAFLVDDEPLALKRLRRLLEETSRVVIVGASRDPADAVGQLRGAAIDVLFLDIQMPELTGFDLLARLDPQPLTVFTTAYDRYALEAFEVNSIDYLLKPIEPPRLKRALDKVDRIRRGSEARPDFERLLAHVASTLKPAESGFPTRLASRTGDRLEFVDLAAVTHFYARDKLTFASTPSKDYAVDYSIAELEKKLDSRRWLRIHRSAILSVDAVQELYGWFAGRLLVRLKGGQRKELTVARDRVKALKERLGL